jgi:hypothetical protein
MEHEEEKKEIEYMLPTEPSYFEGEVLIGEQWMPIKTKDLSRVTKEIRRGTIRVKRLTKEDIEKEGWKYTGKSINIWFEKEGNFERTTWTAYKAILHYNTYDNWMTVYLKDYDNEHHIFQGKCPDINTFRTIQKLLNI